MVKYILKKIGYMIVTLWVILTITFFLVSVIPGDPMQADTKVLPEAVVENLKAHWGLDKPMGGTVCYLFEESSSRRIGRVL